MFFVTNIITPPFFTKKIGTELVPILSRFRSNFASNLLEIRALALFRGKTGIRTPEPVKVNSFQDCRHQPLGQLSFPFGTANLDIFRLFAKNIFKICPGSMHSRGAEERLGSGLRPAGSFLVLPGEELPLEEQ